MDEIERWHHRRELDRIDYSVEAQEAGRAAKVLIRQVNGKRLVLNAMESLVEIDEYREQLESSRPRLRRDLYRLQDGYLLGTSALNVEYMRGY